MLALLSLTFPYAVISSKSESIEEILSSLDVDTDGNIKSSGSSTIAGSEKGDGDDNGFYAQVPTTHPYLRIVPYYPDGAFIALLCFSFHRV